MVFGGKPLTGREKGIAGSSNMADGRHVVWSGKPLSRRGKKDRGFIQHGGRKSRGWGGKPQTGRGSTGSDVMKNWKCMEMGGHVILGGKPQSGGEKGIVGPDQNKRRHFEKCFHPNFFPFLQEGT